MSEFFDKQRGSKEVKWEDDPSKLDALIEEEREAVQKRMEAMDKLLAEQQKAKYKLELFFGEERSLHKAVPGILSFWESGTKLHGGGDAKIYFCPGKQLKLSNCEAPIPFEFNAYGHLVCPACKQAWQGEQVIGEIMGRHTMRQWADVLFLYFQRLGGNCDIYLKHAPNDIRSLAAAEQERQRGGELLARARKRGLYIYPLKNIMTDTAHGADLLGRFYAFLTG